MLLVLYFASKLGVVLVTDDTADFTTLACPLLGTERLAVAIEQETRDKGQQDGAGHADHVLTEALLVGGCHLLGG